MKTEVASKTISDEQINALKKAGFTLVQAKSSDEILVDEGECKIILGNPESITSGGLGPCLGIILESRNPALSLACHLPWAMTADRAQLDSFIKAVVILGIETSKAQIALGGLSAEVSDDKAAYRDFRRFLIQSFKQQGFNLKRNMSFLWATSEELCCVSLSGKTHKLKVESEPNPGWDKFSF